MYLTKRSCGLNNNFSCGELNNYPTTTSAGTIENTEKQADVEITYVTVSMAVSMNIPQAQLHPLSS